MSYRLTRDADDDLGRLYEDGLVRFGEDAADAYYDALLDALNLIGANPHLARLRTELGLTLRIHRFRQHVIVYEVEKEGVLILRVRHGREDWYAQLGG